MKLAILGGKPVRKKLFPANITTGKEEANAVMKVLKRGVLSKYLGSWHPNFYGGEEVLALEREWAQYFKVKHAIAVNSATSGLYAAVGATGVGPAEEIITTPFTMSATATSILVFNAIPVFADIEKDYFCISEDSVKKNITEKTIAIIAVDLFGQPYNAAGINKLAKKYGLYVIEDCAQAPGALYQGRYAGTVSDIGVFSLNYHKHIYSGEGGIVVTDNDVLAEKIRLIRNHAEAVVGSRNFKNIVNMLGFNFRLTEIHAAIARCQLKKLSRLKAQRLSNLRYLEDKIEDIPALEMPKVRPGCTHVYYMHAIKFNEQKAGLTREKFVEALKAELAPFVTRENEGIQIGAGYCQPLYLQPMYQKKILYGNKGCPFKCPLYKKNTSYRKGICPTAEMMYSKELFVHEFIHPFLSKKDLDDVADAFIKVWENRKQLT